MIDIRPFRAEDMVWILSNGVKEFGKVVGDVEPLAKQREENGQCITGRVNGKIIGCGGIDLLWPGVGEVWLMLSSDVDRHSVEAYKVIRNGLKKLIDDNKLWRVQAWGRIGFNDAHTLFKHLGFKPEGIARRYSPDGIDCILYSIVRE